MKLCAGSRRGDPVSASERGCRIAQMLDRGAHRMPRSVAAPERRRGRLRALPRHERGNEAMGSVRQTIRIVSTKPRATTTIRASSCSPSASPTMVRNSPDRDATSWRHAAQRSGVMHPPRGCSRPGRGRRMRRGSGAGPALRRGGAGSPRFQIGGSGPVVCAACACCGRSCSGRQPSSLQIWHQTHPTRHTLPAHPTRILVLLNTPNENPEPPNGFSSVLCGTEGRWRVRIPLARQRSGTAAIAVRTSDPEG